MTVGPIDLHPVIAPVGDIYITLGVDRDAGGAMQVSNAVVGALEHDLKSAFRVETLNPVVLPVGYVNVAVRTHADAPGQVELSLPVTSLPEAA